jgi:UbiD family decarboxylase
MAGNISLSMQEWMKRANAIGELKRVRSADCNLEIGTITELNGKRGGPALYFTDIPGYQEEYGVLSGAMLNSRTLGLTIGIEEKLNDLEMVDKIADILRVCETKASDFLLEFVEYGPVMKTE